MKTHHIDNLLANMQENDVCLLSSGKTFYRNHDVEYPFRPASHFQYLCELQENNTILAIRKTSNGPHITVVAQDNDPVQERWSGKRMSLAQLQQLPHVHQTRDLKELDTLINELSQSCQTIYTSPKDTLLQHHPSLEKITTTDLDPILSTLRLYKDSDEIANMQRAINKTGLGHINAMMKTQPGCNEATIALYLQENAATEGALAWAYPPIIAGGQRACILHYNKNNHVVGDNDLVLIDAGFEYNGYAADITRTYPANGKFSDAQRALYECVYHTQKHTIEQIKPGITFPELNQIARHTMLSHLLDIGFFKGSMDQHVANKSLDEFFYHGIGHWLGLDVHDPCPYQMNNNPTLFSNGMVLTIEPGIYINPNSSVDEKWWGIGIRIEDNIAIEHDKPVNLSAAIPSQIDEVEQLCQR